MFKTKISAPKGGFEKKAIDEYKKKRGDGNAFNTDYLHWVSVDQFRLGDKKNGRIIFTNWINACTGIAIVTDKIVFGAHTSHNHSPENMVRAIKEKCGADEIQAASVKICLGAFDKYSSSLNTALVLLYKLKLLDPFISALQKFLKSLPDIKYNNTINDKREEFSISKLPQMFYNQCKGEMRLDEFMQLESINERDIQRITMFLNRIKESLIGATNSPLQKIDYNDIISTEDAIDLQAATNEKSNNFDAR